jgi:hypothetical protein
LPADAVSYLANQVDKAATAPVRALTHFLRNDGVALQPKRQMA